VGDGAKFFFENLVLSKDCPANWEKAITVDLSIGNEKEDFGYRGNLFCTINRGMNSKK